ncbi:MAG: AAA family ATPase [Phycisphaerales bacterium]
MTNPTVPTSPTYAWAQAWHHAGWHPLPLPPGAKYPPPNGTTGRTGRDLGLDELAQFDWTAANLGIRLPDGIIGIDVDAYRGGLDTMRNLWDLHGPLPDTIYTTSRHDGSGIYLFRCDRQLVGSLDGIDIIQRHHRYAVVPPSIHPDLREPYQLVDQATGEILAAPPVVDQIPWLPDNWVEHLAVPQPAAPAMQPLPVQHPSTLPAAPAVGGKVDEILDRWRSDVASGRSRHDSMLAAQQALARLATMPRGGIAADAQAGLEQLHVEFTTAVADRANARDAELEWQRALAGAATVTATSHSTALATPWTPTVDPNLIWQPTPGLQPTQAIDVTGRPTNPWTDRIRDAIVPIHQIDQVPPPIWLVETMLVDGSLAAIYGQPGSYKTFLALDLAFHIATGMWWDGHPVTRHNVLYVMSEGMAGTPKRVHAWVQHHDLNSLLQGRGDHGQFDFIPIRLDLTDPACVGGILDIAADGGYGAIFIDTLARNMGGANENANDEMKTVVHHLDTIKEHTGACVALVHHQGKNREAGMRGSTVLLGAADTVIHTHSHNDLVTVAVEKQKDFEEAGDRRFRITPVDDTDSIVLTPTFTGPAGPTTVDRRLQVLDMVPAVVDAVRTLEAQEATPSISALRRTTKGRSETKDDALAVAVEAGVLGTTSGPRNATIYHLVDEARAHDTELLNQAFDAIWPTFVQPSSPPDDPDF